MSLLLAAAVTAATCPTVPITPAVRTAEVARIGAATHARIIPASVEYILAAAPWRIVWATPQEAERGVYFFRSGRLVDTWGGVLAPGERRDGVNWAMAAPRRVPARLAGCFADAVLAGH